MPIRLLAMTGILIITTLFMIGLSLRSENRRAMDDRVTELKAMVTAAQGIAARLQGQETAGRITHEAALQSFRDALHAMRYGNNDYIFAYTTDGTVFALPPAPALEGKNRIDLKDPAGRQTIRDLIAVARAGGGTSLSYYPHPGTTQPVPKLNYVTLFKPWDILIASGAFIDDLDAQSHARMLRAGLTSLLAVALAAVLAWLVSRSVTRPLSRLERAMTALAEGDVATPVPDTDRTDEIGRMARW